MHARKLLDQAIALLDEVHLGKVAAHTDMARQLLEEWLCLNAPMPMPKVAGAATGISWD